MGVGLISLDRMCSINGDKDRSTGVDGVGCIDKA